MISLVLVARTYNHSYSGGSDQEDRGSKPAQANCSRDPTSKNPIQTGLVEWLKWYSTCLASLASSEFKTQYWPEKDLLFFRPFIEVIYQQQPAVYLKLAKMFIPGPKGTHDACFVWDKVWTQDPPASASGW
jgi:hypothetical protein